MLPVCLKNIEKPDYFEKSSYTNLSEFKEILSELISANCLALVVDDDIIFNSYNHTRTKSQIIVSNMVRKFIYENPIEICFLAKERIDIYMHQNNIILFSVLVSNGTYNFLYFTKAE
jgi:hypothetical protein